MQACYISRRIASGENIVRAEEHKREIYTV